MLQAQVADVQARGATLQTGGRRLPGPGNWFAATVLSNVDHSMTLKKEESFGPVIGIQKVPGDDEAVRLMNDTRYGLTAGVCTPDEGRARRLLAQVSTGSAYWNCCDRVSPRLPWSGRGDSGVGLTLSLYGIQIFTRPKAWPRLRCHALSAFSAGWHSLCISSCVQGGMFQSGACVFSSRSGP